MRGSFGSVGSDSFAGSSSVMPIGVGVAGRETCSAPLRSVTSTGVATGVIARVAASEIETSMFWSVTVSAWQKVIWFHSSPSRSSRSEKPVLMMQRAHRRVLVGDDVEVRVAADQLLGAVGESVGTLVGGAVGSVVGRAVGAAGRQRRGQCQHGQRHPADLSGSSVHASGGLDE